MASASTTSVITSSFPSANFACPKPYYPQQSPSRVHFRSLRVTASACASTAERTREAPRHVASSSLYEVLGVQAGATCQEIKAAYRKLARVLHPDVNTDQDDHEFIRLHEAYATLSDPQKRADYDRSLFWRGMSSSMTMARGATASAGYTTTRRWETDQCW